MTTSPPPVRKASVRLNEFLQRQPLTLTLLPLVHISRAYAFDTIIGGDALKPQSCDVFQERLTYLFYGRPSYRAKDGNNSRLEFEWPIVFVFDPQKLSGIKRIFPFDTGAFSLRLYSDFFDKNSELSDFLLEPHLESARRMVGTFYQDNNEYYRGETRKNVDIPLRQFEAQGLHELARLPGVQGRRESRVRDERSSAIEVQIDEDILLKEALIALVLPEPYLDDNEIKDAIVRWDVDEIHSYATLHNMSGEVWVGQIYKIVLEIYTRLGFL